ncbi:MAG TPA: anhydro-N-acetylmuramic acid kinase [Holophagaceae bacterium]|nr:anhydro-N-acetylmuramic acid kinase [Holophagaceae bacterium]
MSFPALPLDRPWRVLGLMSGTSADGVDAVVIEVDPAGFRGGRPFLTLRAHHHHPYPEALHHRVVEAASDRLRPGELCVLQRDLGELNAEAAAALAAEAPDLACLHGQTVQHQPSRGATLQLADPYPLALRLNCPVVWDLRRMDMALGGQGAPLVPLTEVWLRGQASPWAALNLGGIANVTLWDGERVQAWDVGPGMSLLDLAARRWLGIPFDPGGAYALGTVEEILLARWMAHPYFAQLPPKSTGREAFGAAWLDGETPALEALPLPDRLATLAAFSAEAIARELGRIPHLPRTGLVSGGGSHHARLRAELAHRLPHLPFTEDEAFPAGAREAISWALLGAAGAAGVPGNVPEVTGASRPAVLGSWAFPSTGSQC